MLRNSGQSYTCLLYYNYWKKTDHNDDTTPSTTYSFSYGNFGLRTNVKVGNNVLASYHYTNDRVKYLQSLAYNNGDSVQYTYDEYGQPTSEIYEDGDTVTYQYDNDGSLACYSFLFAGSVEGFAYEWTIHYAAYNIFSLGGDNNYVASAKDVDVGKTIFDDTSHRFMSKMMITGFHISHPYQAASDQLIYMELTNSPRRY